MEERMMLGCLVSEDGDEGHWTGGNGKSLASGQGPNWAVEPLVIVVVVHGVISHKMEFFISTAARTSNPTFTSVFFFSLLFFCNFPYSHVESCSAAAGGV
jgi:hypothetical protein